MGSDENDRQSETMLLDLKQQTEAVSIGQVHIGQDAATGWTLGYVVNESSRRVVKPYIKVLLRQWYSKCLANN